MLPKVIKIGIKAAKIVPKGTRRYPNAARFMANGCPKDRKKFPLGGLLEKYVAAILGTK